MDEVVEDDEEEPLKVELGPESCSKRLPGALVDGSPNVVDGPPNVVDGPPYVDGGPPNVVGGPPYVVGGCDKDEGVYKTGQSLSRVPPTPKKPSLVLARRPSGCDCWRCCLCGEGGKMSKESPPISIRF